MARRRTERKNRFSFWRFAYGNGEERPFTWRRRYPRYRYESAEADAQQLTGGQPFGDETSFVNALRMRRIYRDVSLRLLADLVEMSLVTDKTAEGGELDADYKLVQRAAESSACLYRSLRLQRRLRIVKERPLAHAMVVAQEAGLDAPVDALTQLLAASLARQFDEAAVAVLFSGKAATAHVWIKDELVHVGHVASYEKLIGLVSAILKKRGFGPEPFFHVLVAGGASADLPSSFRGPRRARGMGDGSPTGYDRIVYLTRTLPDRVPGQWAGLLADILRPRMGKTKKPDQRGPYFSSFVATLLPDGKASQVSKFATEPVDAELQTPQSRRGDDPPGWRIWRDACRLPLNLKELGAGWDPSKSKDGSGVKAFVDEKLKSNTVRPAVERWGRAVTNRQVGVALSGGGASSYRLVPLLKGLDKNNVPVDVLSGVSGGALLGAYYCAEGTKGLERCIDAGPRFTRAMLTAIAQPNRVRDVVNKDLGEINVEDTDVRFVAVTTALLEKSPPETHQVIGGTLGEAAQASGAAPLLFAPVQVNGDRFSDGASASLIPVRVLKDCGADFVFAFNCLPGPPRRNPMDYRPGGKPLYEWTVVGRLVDLWVSSGSMMQRLSREACEDAHVFFEPANDELFLIESVQFHRAREIAEKGMDSATGEVPPAVLDCVSAWNRLRRGGSAFNGARPAGKASRSDGVRGRTARVTKPRSRRGKPSKRRAADK